MMLINRTDDEYFIGFLSNAFSIRKRYKKGDVEYLNLSLRDSQRVYRDKGKILKPRLGVGKDSGRRFKRS